MRLACLLLVAACSSSPPSPGTGHPPTTPATQPATVTPEAARVPLYPGGEPRFEGASFKNGCAADDECRIGGCGGEICTAEEGVNSVCVAYPDAPRGASCGCVKGECVWYKAAAAGEAPVESAAGGAGQGEPCKDGKCAAGLSCVSYYGIAGPRGPAFTSCEIRCALAGSTCPEGQKCITIADGPGQVCRPKQ